MDDEQPNPTKLVSLTPRESAALTACKDRMAQANEELARSQSDIGTICTIILARAGADAEARWELTDNNTVLKLKE